MRTTILNVVIVLVVVTGTQSTAVGEPLDTVAQKNPRLFLGIRPEYTFAGTGAKIGSVTKDGPAARAGMKAGDIIIKVGDDEIKKLSDFVFVAVRLKIGRMVKFVAKRGGKAKTFIVVPIARKKR